MNQLGIIYSWQTKLPNFNSLTKSPINNSTIITHLSNLNLASTSKNQDKISNIINLAETEFYNKFSDLFANDLFYQTLIWTKQNSWHIRLTCRNLYLNKIDKTQAISELNTLKYPNNKIKKNIFTYIQSLLINNIKDINQLETDLDKLILTVIKKSTNNLNSTQKKYVSLLNEQFEIQSNNRLSAIKSNQNQDNNTQLTQSAQAECQYVNQSLYNFNSHLIALKCLINYKYFFYNLKILSTIKPPQLNQLLVNYDLI